MSINIVVLASVLVGLGWTTGTSTSILDQRSASRNFSHDCVYSLGVEEQDANACQFTQSNQTVDEHKVEQVCIGQS